MLPVEILLRRMNVSRCIMRVSLCLAVVVWVAAVLSPSAVVAQEPKNLLQNPGFELPHVALIGKENCFVAAPWVAWWRHGSVEEQSLGYLLAPEYKGSTRADFPGNRVRNGDFAQQWFHSFGNFEAGVLQQVGGITPGSRLRLDWWAMSWSCDKESKGNCEGATSGDPSPMHLRIGIDPTGGTDYNSPQIVWSDEQNAYDAWYPFSVEAVAASSTVTVFFYSYPEYRSQDNNVYIDDASLVVVAPPPTATRRPATRVPPSATPAPATATTVPTETPTQTPPPPTEPPVPTDTTPPTYTPAPTYTFAPTYTDVPTYTPPPTYTPQPAVAPTATPPSPTRPASSGSPSSPVLLVVYGLVVGLVLALLFTRRKSA